MSKTGRLLRVFRYVALRNVTYGPALRAAPEAWYAIALGGYSRSALVHSVLARYRPVQV